MNGCPKHGVNYLVHKDGCTYCSYIMPDGFLCLYHPATRSIKSSGKCKICGKPTNRGYCYEHLTVYNSFYSKVRYGKITRTQMSEELNKLKEAFHEAGALSNLAKAKK
jgi:hypothetical protein